MAARDTTAGGFSSSKLLKSLIWMLMYLLLWCRYMKCLNQGMRREAVQEERGIGKGSVAQCESRLGSLERNF